VSRDVVFHELAEADLATAFVWYSQRSSSAADELWQEIRRTIEAIARNPAQFARFDENARGGLVRRFPFRIVYRYDSSRILILAVAHVKRRPGFWHDRVS
jgi:plasmid stabilization system protein ParE